MATYTQDELLKLLSDPYTVRRLDLTELKITEATPEGLTQIFAKIRGLIREFKIRGFRELGLGLNICRLDLSANQLTYLPEGLFQGLTKLQCLWLNNNQLMALPEGLFQGLTTLWYLELNNNQLRALPEGLFQGLITLQYIELYNNHLSALPEGLFQGLTALATISLSRNKLSTLPAGLFQGLTALAAISLSRNKLSDLPEGLFQELTALRDLYLSHNHLNVLPQGLFEGLALSQGYPQLDGNFNFGPEGEIHTLPEMGPSVETVFDRIMAEHDDNLDILDRALGNAYPGLTFSDEQIKTLDEARTRALGQKTMLFKCITKKGVPKEIGDIVLSLTGHHFKPIP